LAVGSAAAPEAPEEVAKEAPANWFPDAKPVEDPAVEVPLAERLPDANPVEDPDPDPVTEEPANRLPDENPVEDPDPVDEAPANRLPDENPVEDPVEVVKED